MRAGLSSSPNVYRACRWRDLWREEYGGVYHFRHDFVDGVYTLIFYHELGRNFTAYLSEAFKETIRLLVADSEVVESERQLVIHVKR